MHVGVEEAVTKYLGKKDFHTVLGQRFQIDMGSAQPINLTDGNTMNAFHHHHITARVFPVHLRDVQ